MFGKAKNEGRSAAEMYGRKTPKRIVSDQRKEANKKNKK
jgi:hypothetical protein